MQRAPPSSTIFLWVRACSHYGHIRVARPKTPVARREGEGGSSTRRDFATQRQAFSAATRRERASWDATLRCPPREDAQSSLRRCALISAPCRPFAFASIV